MVPLRKKVLKYGTPKPSPLIGLGKRGSLDPKHRHLVPKSCQFRVWVPNSQTMNIQGFRVLGFHKIETLRRWRLGRQPSVLLLRASRWAFLRRKQWAKCLKLGEPRFWSAPCVRSWDALCGSRAGFLGALGFWVGVS